LLQPGTVFQFCGYFEQRLMASMGLVFVVVLRRF
jgi:hypothetical protein